MKIKFEVVVEVPDDTPLGDAEAWIKYRIGAIREISGSNALMDIPMEGVTNVYVSEWPSGHADRSNDTARPVPADPVNARLLECISEAVSAYERYGGICTFEGEPMIYASTLIEIAEIAAEAQP